MSGSLKLSITTRARGKPSGFDSAIVRAMPGWYAVVDGERAFLAQVAELDLGYASGHLAARLGEKLHHAEWTVTGDPAEVKALGLMHDCVTCRAGVDQALAFLRENPGSEVAVGQLWWARQ